MAYTLPVVQLGAMPCGTQRRCSCFSAASLLAWRPTDARLRGRAVRRLGGARGRVPAPARRLAAGHAPARQAHLAAPRHQQRLARARCFREKRGPGEGWCLMCDMIAAPWQCLSRTSSSSLGSIKEHQGVVQLHLYTHLACTPATQGAGCAPAAARRGSKGARTSVSAQAAAARA